MHYEVFIDNLPFDITQTQLEEVFSQFGKIINCNIIVDSMAPDTKKLASIEFKAPSSMWRAKSLHMKNVFGRRITVYVDCDDTIFEDTARQRGRKRKYCQSVEEFIASLYLHKKLSSKEVCLLADISKKTLDKYIKQYF